MSCFERCILVMGKAEPRSFRAGKKRGCAGPVPVV